MDAAELIYAGVSGQAEMVRSAEVSARELAEASLARIERLDERLNAFRTVLAERALAEADQADARRAAGDTRPLLGVPIAIKDVADVAREVTTYGTRIRRPPAAADAELVARLRAAGAVIVGKTQTSELALWPFTESATFGTTFNPWNLDRTPGGSSGGSAVAVAAGMVAGAHATDLAGSIRIPAASCGVFGIKPQHGRVPLAPVPEGHWQGLHHAGPLTRSVEDAALLLDAMTRLAGAAPRAAAREARRGADRAGADPESFAAAAARPPGRLRIAVATDPPIGAVGLDDGHRRAVEDTASVLSDLGHEVSRCELDYGWTPSAVAARYLRAAHEDIGQLGRSRRRLERRSRAAARLGSLIPRAMIDRERAHAHRAAERLNRPLAGRDLLLTPTIVEPPPETGRYEGMSGLGTLISVVRGFGAPYTSIWNLTGQPAASVPAGFGRHDLPLSVQLIAPAHGEATLLALAAQLEAARPWAHARPPVG